METHKQSKYSSAFGQHHNSTVIFYFEVNPFIILTSQYIWCSFSPEANPTTVLQALQGVVKKSKIVKGVLYVKLITKNEQVVELTLKQYYLHHQSFILFFLHVFFSLSIYQRTCNKPRTTVPETLNISTQMSPSTDELATQMRKNSPGSATVTMALDDANRVPLSQ